MNIKIDTVAREMFDNQNIKNITIYGILPVGCWGAQKPTVFVRLREPKQNQKLENFEIYEEDGIKFFIDKGLDLEDTITIKKAKYPSDLPEQEFIIEGQI